jgi:hypothetical protein
MSMCTYPNCLCKRRSLCQYSEAEPTPVDMILHCPRCHMQHIDCPEPAPANVTIEGVEPWNNPPHKSHFCVPYMGGCGFIWRPANVPTNGVASMNPRGRYDHD